MALSQYIWIILLQPLQGIVSQHQEEEKVAKIGLGLGARGFKILQISLLH